MHSLGVIGAMPPAIVTTHVLGMGRVAEQEGGSRTNSP